MKALVVVEHDNKTVKPSTYSTITASSTICNDVEAIVIGSQLNSVIDELKKADFLKKISVIDKACL